MRSACSTQYATCGPSAKTIPISGARSQVVPSSVVPFVAGYAERPTSAISTVTSTTSADPREEAPRQVASRLTRLLREVRDRLEPRVREERERQRERDLVPRRLRPERHAAAERARREEEGEAEDDEQQLRHEVERGER